MSRNGIDRARPHITVQCGEILTIKLESNPTTGYRWHPVFDESYLKLVANEFIPMTEFLGASGVERFDFKTMKKGKTKVKMIYGRVWEAKSLREKEFSVIIR